MTDELIAQLAQVGALKVISRTSVMQYKTAPKPVPQVARELGVDAVVEGSVRRSGNRVRITAQLIEGTTGLHLWAQSLDRDMGDVLTLQSDVARALVQEIRVTVTPSEQGRLGQTRSVDAEAYQLYLRGNHLMLQTSEGTFERARDAYEQAIERDSRFARAYAGLAMAYLEMGSWWGPFNAGDVRPKAKESIDRALELDDGVADTYFALGHYKYYGWDWSGAESAFRRGVALNPSLSYGRMTYANFLTAMGRLDESVALGRETLERDPLSPAVYNELAWPLLLLRRDAEAFQLVQKGLELDPSYSQSHWLLGEYHFYRNEKAEAVAAMERAAGPLLRGNLSILGYVYGKTGRPDRAREVLEVLETKARNEYVSPQEIAYVLIGLGSYDQALDLLEKAHEERDPRLVFLKVLPSYAPLRSNRRFQDLLRRMNFPN